MVLWSQHLTLSRYAKRQLIQWIRGLITRNAWLSLILKISNSLSQAPWYRLSLMSKESLSTLRLIRDTRCSLWTSRSTSMTQMLDSSVQMHQVISDKVRNRQTRQALLKLHQCLWRARRPLFREAMRAPCRELEPWALTFKTWWRDRRSRGARQLAWATVKVAR